MVPIRKEENLVIYTGEGDYLTCIFRPAELKERSRCFILYPKDHCNQFLRSNRHTGCQLAHIDARIQCLAVDHSAITALAKRQQRYLEGTPSEYHGFRAFQLHDASHLSSWHRGCRCIGRCAPQEEKAARRSDLAVNHHLLYGHPPHKQYPQVNGTAFEGEEKKKGDEEGWRTKTRIYKDAEVTQREKRKEKMKSWETEVIYYRRKVQSYVYIISEWGIGRTAFRLNAMSWTYIYGKEGVWNASWFN